MINRTLLTGRLTADPELRYTPQGTAVANFRMAVQRNFKDGQTGEYEADFISVVAWQATAELVANHFKKGSLIGVDGRLQSRSFEGQDGKKVYVTEVVADSVSFLEKKEEEKPQRGNWKNKR